MSESSEKPEDLYDNETTNAHLSGSTKNEKCEVSNELLSYRDIMLKNQFDLKKKEEEVQGYADKLTKIKSKVKSSRHSTDSTTKIDESDDSIHNISDAKTPSEKSLLLKKKVEENRKIFELRNKELNESKRAAEVQVEKILQQLNDGSSISSNIPFVNPIDNKDKQISELNSKINELESIIVDLKDSLSNKDSVIESKTKAITLVTDNLSQKSKVTLDKLEDTKDEMRHMQETFIAAEEGFKIKINNLLSQLQERDSNIAEYEDKFKNVSSENDQLKSQIDNYNDIISNKDKQIIELEEKFKLEEDLHNLINEKDNQITKLQSNIQELNHNMIKIKAQSKSKLKNLQDRLDSYYKSSSSNEEEVNLVNKVAILEEEIGNLQLVLVDFDEMKVINDDLKKRITELEDQLVQKTEEVKSYNNKIVALENQKFELIQELHEVKQELLALDSLKCVEFEEKQELCNQDHSKDTTNNVTQNNLEVIETLNQLQNQVNMVLNEKKALKEKFKKIAVYLNSNNETLTNLKSEIINLKHWNDDQCHVIQELSSGSDENQLESTQRHHLLDYHKGLSDKNHNLELQVIEITNSIDIFKNLYEQLINDNNDWTDQFFFKNIDTSDIEALENLNIINLLSNNSFIPGDNSRSKHNINNAVIENLVKLIDLDDEHISHSELLINELAERLEKKGELLNESDHDKLLIDKLTGEIHSLSRNMVDKRNSLQTIMNDTSLENVKSISNQVIQDSILVLDNKRIIDDETQIIDDKSKSVSELQDKISTLENQLMEKDQLNNNNVIKINELSDEIVNLRETLVVCERNLTQALHDKESLEIQIREKEEKLESMNEKYNENKILQYEVENKINIIETIEKEKLIMENQVKEAREINEDILVKSKKLSYEVDVLNQKLVEYEQNYASLLNDNKMLENKVKINDEKFESMNVLQKQIEKLNEELINKNKMIEAIQNEKTMLENQLQEKEHLNHESTTKVNQLSDEIMVLNQRLTEYDEHFTIALNDKQLLSEQIKVKDEQLALINELNSQIDQLTTIIRNKETHLESLSNEKNSLENELRQKIELTQDNALRIDEQTSEISQLLKKNEEYKDQIQEYNEKLNSMKELHGQIEELNKKLENKDKEMESIINEKHMLNDELEKKEEMYQDSLVSIHNWSCEVNYLFQVIAEQKEDLAKFEKNKEILENELKTRDERIQQLSIEKEAQHAKSTLNINILSSEIDTLKKQVNDYEQNITAISSDKETLESEIIQRNAQLKAMNSLKDQIEVLHTELSNKNHLIDSLTTQKLTVEEKLRETEQVREKVDQLNREIADKEVAMEEILKEKNILMEKLEETKQLNETNAIKMEEFRKEIESAKAVISKRDVNITSLLDNITLLEEELRKAKEQWSNDKEKLGIIEGLNVQLKNEVDDLNKMKSEMEFSQSARAKCMENLNEVTTELENVVKSIDSQSIENTNKISWLEQELELAKKHNSNQIQKMRIIAANLKKKTNQCQEFENAAKEFKEKWENEVSEKKKVVMKLEMLESNLNEKYVKIVEFNELLDKRKKDLQYFREKIEILESDINNRVVQFNNLREKIVTELENCKKEHLVDESLKETYKKILELGTQVKEMELRNISDWSLLGLLKSENEDLVSDTYLYELQENTGVDYSDKYNMFEFVASKIIEDAGTDRKDFKNIISKMAEKYVIIESLKFKNKKLIEIIDSINANRQVSNEQSQPSQITESLEIKIEEESVKIVSDAPIQEETGQIENIEEANQPPINLDDEEVWGWNEENTGPSEFKIPICTPETQLQIKIAELEDKVKDLQDKKTEVDEELKVIKIKNKKLIKKLQEYKIQNSNLQQQIKLQSNSSKLNDLDYTIEEELKSQITQLEANLNKLKEDNEKISTERDNLLNKIEMLTATKDELNKTMAMKNNELMMQIQHLGQSIQSNDSTEKFSSGKSTDSESGAVNQDKCIEHEEKISKLEEDLNDILSENNELKALIDTYETELNLKTKEMEKLSNQTEYSKLNFFNMLEESHTEKKECLDNLSDVFAKSENISADHQSTLEKERVENEELKATVSTLKEVEQDLNEKISKLEKDLEEKNTEIDAMRHSCYHLESLWHSELQKRAEMEQEHEEIINKLHATEEELKEVISINEPKLAESKTEILTLENHINKLRQELEAKNEEIMILSSNYDKLKYALDEQLQQNNEPKLAESKTEILTLENHINKLRQELEAKNEEIMILSSNYDKLKYALDEQLQQNNELQSKYDEIVNEIKLKTSEFDQQYLEKEMKIGNLEQSLKETLETLHNKAQELNDLEQRLRDLQNLNKEEPLEPVSELQIIQLSESEKLVDQEIHMSEETDEKSIKKPENYSKLYEDLQRQLAETNEAMTNVTDLLNIRVQEVADLKQYIKKLEFDKMAVDNANSEFISINLKLTDKNQELTHRLNTLKAELDEKIQVILSLEAKLVELQALHDGAISDLNNQNLEIKSLKDVINNNEVLIKNLEASVVDRDLQISNVREELSQCHHKIEELSTMISDLQNSMISPEKFNEKLHVIERLEETIETMKEEHNVLTDEYEKKLSENTIALDELKSNLSIKNEEVEDLKYILNENTYPGMIQELQNKIDHLYEEKQQLQLSVTEKADELSSQTNKSKNNANNDDQSQVEDSISSELDAALYMLHQRDVRCEELTHELLQLLEERDTLQLRLSNAIKINEELKKYTPSTSKVLADDLDNGSGGEAASSSTTSAKPLEPKEDMDVLNQKLSQLHNVNYHRDIRLIDERESRHVQQMSVIPHKNTLNSSSTVSSAKIIDANYTVSRDVQSQPNVLLNWLWGKSTPKATQY